MRIVQLTPGAGGNFYCENCLRDGAMVRAVRAAGHDMLLVPLYLPPRTEQIVPGAETPVFFGGVNVYLQQKWGLFRHTPRWLDRIFDARPLLRWAARKTGATNARLLGQTTLSMLRGEDGRQVKELRRLVDWLIADGRPDVICLSNVLLAGLVPRIKAELNVPVICILQDEDGFVDSLGRPYSRQAWEMLSERAAEIDAFVPVSHYYAEQMCRRLSLSREGGWVQVVHVGLDATDYGPADEPPDPPAIGFLSQMCRSKGLDTLAEAFAILKRNPAHQRLKLRIAGGKTAADEPFLRDIRRRLERAGLAGDVEFLEEFDLKAKQRFLRSLSVMSVPSRQGEAFGLFVLESLACGVPVVLPRHGAFVELVEATGGGVLCEPNDPAALARAIEPLLQEPASARQLGMAGRDAVLKDFTVQAMADGMMRVFDAVTAGAR